MTQSSWQLTPAIAQALADDGRRVVITGAGGWLGMASLELLRAALGEKEFAGRVRAFGSSTRTLRLADGTQVLQRPLADMAWLPQEPTLVLHTAFLTKDRAEAMDEAQYRAANAGIRQAVLDALDAIGAQGVFVASSGAAGMADAPDASAAMRLYGTMKREDEAVFAQWAQAQGKAAVIARIFSLAGPHINKPGAYALASFALDALAGRPIAVRSPRGVVRSYVAIAELMSLVFAQLLHGGITRFDSGGQPLELGEVAQRLAALVPGASVQRAAITQEPADVYHGDGAAYAALLAAHGVTPVSLDDALAATLHHLAKAAA
jgi:UDP-glucuronate decarboxylase